MIAADDPKREVEPEEMEDFGFHYPPEYLARACWVLEASNFTFWPQAGGLDDQDSFLIDDIITWFRLMRRLRWEYEHEIWRNVDKPPAQPHYNPLEASH